MNSQGCSHARPLTGREPIPGYIVKEMIGSGGYGEVWKVHAPGGMLKAIKIVYGEANAKRAVQELRSINRIKDVRHPFLISIERIEIVGGNVVIVTELADQNLKQLFNHQSGAGASRNRAEGVAQIPRVILPRPWTTSTTTTRCNISTSNPRICSWSEIA